VKLGQKQKHTALASTLAKHVYEGAGNSEEGQDEVLEGTKKASMMRRKRKAQLQQAQNSAAIALAMAKHFKEEGEGGVEEVKAERLTWFQRRRAEWDVKKAKLAALAAKKGDEANLPRRVGGDGESESEEGGHENTRCSERIEDGIRTVCCNLVDTARNEHTVGS
jgi:hypothetical protein